MSAYDHITALMFGALRRGDFRKARVYHEHLCQMEALAFAMKEKRR